jgi:hypothetical protein
MMISKCNDDELTRHLRPHSRDAAQWLGQERSQGCPSDPPHAQDWRADAKLFHTAIRGLNVVKASSRADELWSERSMVCGQLLLRSDICRVYWKDIDLDLTFGEYNIVHLLASKMRHYLTYRVIYDKLNYEDFVAGTGSRAIGRMCGPQSNAFAKSFTTSTRHSTGSKLRRLRVLLEKARLKSTCGRRHRFSERLVSTEGCSGWETDSTRHQRTFPCPTYLRGATVRP